MSWSWNGMKITYMENISQRCNVKFIKANIICRFCILSLNRWQEFRFLMIQNLYCRHVPFEYCRCNWMLLKNINLFYVFKEIIWFRKFLSINILLIVVGRIECISTIILVCFMYMNADVKDHFNWMLIACNV